MAGFGAAGNGGAVDIVFDGEVPRSFTGRAREVLSGGQFVTVSGAANVVGSTVSDFIPGSVVVSLISGTLVTECVGIALHNTGSNEPVAVATRGMYIATSADAISGGIAVQPVQGPVQGLVAFSQEHNSGTQIGRAITAATSGTNTFCLVNFSF